MKGERAEIRTLSENILIPIVTWIWEPKANGTRIVNETSIFWKNVLLNHDLQCFYWNHQRFLKESSANHQWNINISGISTVETTMFIHAWIEKINVLSMLRQCSFKESSKNHLWNIYFFGILYFVTINDLQCLHRKHQSIINVASMSNRCFFNEQACFFMITIMNQQCYQRVLDWGRP